MSNSRKKSHSSKVIGKAKVASAESRCPLTANPRRRLVSDQQTDSIEANFPRGVSKPALRALFAAGLTTLDHLKTVHEAELAALHGMGPKAIALLHAALAERGFDFKHG